MPDRLKDILYEAIDMAPPSRIAFLDRVCNGDDSLRARIETLLDAHDADHAFMRDSPTPTELDPPDVHPGDALGPYRLIRQLGEGGFGTVFLAEQSEPLKRQVAIKILKPGMDTRHVIARFEAERHLLALMDHPSIARVHDAGSTPTGRPYVVMEYVDGPTVTDYCDRNALSIPARLAIFERICSAVQHAHQKGVIHRDIKPSNVLIAEADDGQPVPKVIDFGIAKAIATDRPGISRLTLGRQLLGTPEYMSPEQAAGAADRLDTRSDVYSLGVLLYELLSGESPFDRERLRTAGPAELERILREDAPPKPSTRLIALDPVRLDAIATKRASDPIRMPRLLKGDLDWIAMRALEKEPDRRYPSAYALGADVRRHLSNQPVEAGPPSTLYALRKLLQRHRGPAIAASIAALAVLAALIITNISLYRVTQANQRAAERLWTSYLAQSRAARQGIRPGRRFDSLEAIAAAAAIRPSLELRNEAIACFALPDIRKDHVVPDRPFATTRGLAAADRYAYQPNPGLIRVATIDTDKTVAELPCPDTTPRAAMFSSDGRYLSIAFEGPRITWDLTTGDRILELGAADHEPTGIALIRDDRSHYQAHLDRRGALRIHDLPSGDLRAQILIEPGRNCLAASPDGARIAVGHLTQRTIAIVDTATATIIRRIDAPHEVWDLDFSADGATLACGSGNRNIYLFDTDTWNIRAQLQGHQAVVVSIDFASSGHALASYGWDNAIWLWDTAEAAPIVGPLEGWGLAGFADTLATLQHTDLALWTPESASDLAAIDLPASLDTFASIDLSPEGRLALIAGASGVHLYDIASATIHATLTDDPAYDATFDDDSARILGAFPDGVRAWPIEAGNPGTPTTLIAQRGEQRLRLTADPTRLILTSPNGVAIHDDRTGEQVASLGPYRGLTTPPSTTPDQGYAFTGNWKGSGGRVRDFATGRTRLQIDAAHVVGQFSPDGALLIVLTGRDIFCYEAATWTELWRRARDNADDLAGIVRFSSDGEIVALGNSRYRLDLCRPRSGEILASFESPEHQALGDVAFSEDGATLAIVSTINLAHVYDLSSIRERLAAIGLDWE